MFNATGLLNKARDFNFTRRDIEKFRREQFYRHYHKGKILQEGVTYSVLQYRQQITKEIENKNRNFTTDDIEEIFCLSPANKRIREYQ